MKAFRNFLFGVVALLAFAVTVSAQTLLVNTTLSAAVSSSSATSVVVTSATGINAPSSSDSTKSTYIYVDRELMDVRSVSGTTLGVVRGVAGTSAQAHASSAVVFVIPAYLSTVFSQIPHGSCTRANEVALPRIEVKNGVFSDCNGGQWISSAPYTESTFAQPAIGIRVPDPGATAYTSLETNGTAPGAATEEYCTEINLPYSMVITGLGVLNGTTVGTDNHLVVLRDSGGKVLATSALAGALAASASAYQKFALTAKYFAVGPSRYYGCVQTNGTTATLRHMVTGINDGVAAGKLTGQTFGTVVAATPPTTFTTALGPYLIVY